MQLSTSGKSGNAAATTAQATKTPLRTLTLQADYHHNAFAHHQRASQCQRFSYNAAGRSLWRMAAETDRERRTAVKTGEEADGEDQSDTANSLFSQLQLASCLLSTVSTTSRQVQPT